MIALSIILGVVALIGLTWLVLTYNRLVSLRNHIRESAAHIDVELKRRFDLIPNLVNTVKAYAAHEQQLLERVVALRQAAHAHREEDSAERQLCQNMQRLLALAEQYPDLKADQGFADLQRELVHTEDRLAAARRFFNANVRDYRNCREQFPSSLVAGMANFPTVAWLVTEDEERRLPQVSNF